MARLYPSHVDKWNNSSAERKVFYALKKLDDDYLVFHSVKWQRVSEKDYPARDGESDFVIVHPQQGILILEVKGGVIKLKDQVWQSIDRRGISHPATDPFYQARKLKYKLLDEIKQKLRIHQKITIGYAVAFPDVTVNPDILLGMEAPRKIIMDQNDIQDISKWVEQALGHYYEGGSMDGEIIKFLIKLLNPEYELKPILWSSFKAETNKIIRLTENQYKVLQYIRQSKQALIYGVAGSGKTMLALEKARMLSKQGLRVLLTCYNKALAGYIEHQIKQIEDDSDFRNIEVQHFHSLCMSCVVENGIAIPEKRDTDFWDNQLPDLFLEAISRIESQGGLEFEKYDAVIVDEGQDFHDHWWTCLQLIQKDQAVFYIFSDETQALYENRGKMFPIQSEPIILHENLRNTQKIYALLPKFKSPKFKNEALQHECLGPPGRKVEIVYTDEEVSSLYAQINEVINTLLDEGEIPANEICILTPIARHKSHLKDLKLSSSAKLSDKWPPENNCIYWDTIYSFKGLECSAVIIVELDYWLEKYTGETSFNHLKSLLYVGCSRARNHLVIVLRKSEKKLNRVILGK